MSWNHPEGYEDLGFESEEGGAGLGLGLPDSGDGEGGSPDSWVLGGSLIHTQDGEDHSGRH